MNKRKSEKEWEKIVEEFKRSGLNLTAWCRKNNISKSSIYPYIKKFNSSKESLGKNWVSIPVRKISETAAFSLKIGTAILDIRSGFDKDELSELLDVVIKLC
jgi:transposase